MTHYTNTTNPVDFPKTERKINKRIRELMLEAGYATPEMAGRALRLSELVVNECIKECKDYSATILKYSQFGSNAATDCAKILQQKLKDVE